MLGVQDVRRGMALMRQGRELGRQVGSVELLLRGAVLEVEAVRQ